MPNEQNPSGAPDGAPAGQGSAPSAGQQGTADAVAAQQIAEATGWKSPDDIRKAIVEGRESNKALKAILPAVEKIQEFMSRFQGGSLDGHQAAPVAAQGPAATSSAAPSSLAAELAELKAKDAFREVVDSLDAAPTKDQRKRLEALYMREKPTDTAKWLGDTLPLLGMSAASAPAANAAAQTMGRVGPSDTGSPAPPGSAVPKDLRAWSPAMAANASPQEVKATWEAMKREKGAFQHPLLAFRREDQGEGDVGQAVTVLANALKGLAK